MPVFVREWSPKIKEEECQKVLFSAEDGCNIQKFNKCTKKWELAAIYCKLYVLVPNGVICTSGKSQFILGHTKSSPISYFILPRNINLIHLNGFQEHTRTDYMIRFLPKPKFQLVPQTPINYGDDNKEMSFNRREIEVDLNYVDLANFCGGKFS